MHMRLMLLSGLLMCQHSSIKQRYCARLFLLECSSPCTTVHLTRIIISLLILLEWPTDYDKLEIYCGTCKENAMSVCLHAIQWIIKKVRTWVNPSCSESLSNSNGNSLGTRVENNSSSKREVKLTSEWLKGMWIVQIPFTAAAAFASPCNVTSGTPSSFGRISISFIAALAPLDGCQGT